MLMMTFHYLLLLNICAGFGSLGLMTSVLVST